MGAIARGELIQLVRNRSVLATCVLVPLSMAALFIALRTAYGGAPAVAALTVGMIAGFGVYVTATTTIAARRQSLFLKRLRSTAASDGGIVAGLTWPLVAVNLVQLAVVLVALTIVGGAPAEPVLLVAGVVAIEAMFLTWALATSGLTNSPEHAQVTTLPLFFLATGVELWVLFTGTDDLALVKRLLPGGAAAELMMGSWQGMALSEGLTLLAPTLAWAVVGGLAAAKYFRWEPRRG